MWVEWNKAKLWNSTLGPNSPFLPETLSVASWCPQKLVSGKDPMAVILSVKTQVRISPQWRVPGLSEWEGVEQSPNLIPSLYKPRGNHRPERMGQPRVCSPWTPPECLPCGLILSGHSVTVGPLMDHLPQHICIFPLSVIGRWKALSSSWKNSRHLLQVGEEATLGQRGKGEDPCASGVD